MRKEEIEAWLKGLQDTICKGLENLDGVARFREDSWIREGGGGGRSRIIESSNASGFIEKGGVNYSAVHGTTPDFLRKEARELKPELPDSSTANFFATGVSLVIHPFSPWVPIVHMNVRYFRLNDEVQWFGGGIDLTPVFVVEDDARYFHMQLKKVCDRHHPQYYPEFKKWADDYFYIRHRDETRGVGGIFFDKLATVPGISMDDRFQFLREVGELFIPVYSEIVNRNRAHAVTDEEKEWQLLRRGRYAEFNLVYDRGTRFGLETGGRTESILMSLPPKAQWTYDYPWRNHPEQEKTMQLLKKGIDWA
jgi:coproporphyrinogen III oxidase